MAFHPRPQIASDLGRNVTCSSNPHRNRTFGLWLQINSQRASTRCDVRIASPTPPLYPRWPGLPKSQIRGLLSQNLGRQAAANCRIAPHKALVTRPKYPPPYRETGVAIPLSYYVSCGIADYRCYTLTSFRRNGLSNPKTGLGRRASQKKNCLWSLSHHKGASHEIVSPIAL